jgi:twitching motility protein PilJ
VFSQVLDGLRNGNEELGITAVRGAAAGRAGAVAAEVEAMKQDADAILASSRQLFAAQSAATALGQGSAHMLDDSRKLFEAFSSFGSVSDTRLFPNFWIGVVSGALSLIAIIGFVSTNVRSRSREQELRYQTRWSSTAATSRRSCGCWTKSPRWVRVT